MENHQVIEETNIKTKAGEPKKVRVKYIGKFGNTEVGEL